jgi:thioredoxin 1
MQTIPSLSEAQFEHAIADDKLVVIDFWASWCNPCKQLAPILEEISDERQDAVAIYKTNIEDEPGLAARHMVMSVPTLVFYRSGKKIRTVSGGKTKDELDALIAEEMKP